MEEKLLDLIAHDLTSAGQMFKSYADLLENDCLNVCRKKEKEIMRKCAKRCMELRQIVIERIA